MNHYLIAFIIVVAIFLAVMFLCVMATSKKRPIDLEDPENMRRLLDGRRKK